MGEEGVVEGGVRATRQTEAGMVQPRRALISVWDKSGIIELAATLHQLGAEILSTGGTAQARREGAVPVTAGEAVTRYPAGLDGRGETLPPPLFSANLGGGGAPPPGQRDELGATPRAPDPLVPEDRRCAVRGEPTPAGRVLWRSAADGRNGRACDAAAGQGAFV